MNITVLLHIDKLKFKSKLHTRYLKGLVLCIMAASDNYFHTYLQFFFHEFVKLWHPAEGEVTVGQEHPVTLRGKTTVMLKKLQRVILWPGQKQLHIYSLT